MVSQSKVISLINRCKVQTPEHVGLAVLLKNLTGSAKLVKVRQTLCRVGDSSNIPNGILLDVKNFLCAGLEINASKQANC